MDNCAANSLPRTDDGRTAGQSGPLDPFLVRAWLWWTMQTVPTRIAIEIVAFWVMLGVTAALLKLFA